MTTFCSTGCGQPSQDMCGGCWRKIESALGKLYADGKTGWLVAELDTALTKQVRFGRAQLGIITRSAGQPLVVNLAASDVLHQLRSTLTTWTRLLHAEHAIRWQECDTCNAHWYGGAMQHNVMPPLLCQGEWVEQVDPLTVGNTLAALAQWLLRHPTWIRSHSAAGQLFRDITRTVDAAVVSIDRPAEQTYLGICSATVSAEDEELAECPVALYSTVGDAVAKCWGCGNTHVVADRLRVLTRAVENELAPMASLVGLVGELGTALTSSAIRGMKHRGQLQPKVRGDDGYIRLRNASDEGPDMYRVGDVLDMLPKLRRPQAKKAS